MLLSILSGLLIAALLILVAPVVGQFFDEPQVTQVLRALAIGFVIDGFGVISDSLLQRHLRFRQVMMCENVSYVFGTACVGITLAMLGFGVWALVYSSLAMKVTRLGLLLWMEPVSVLGRVSWQSSRALLDRGVGFSLGRMLNFAALQGDNFVVGRLLGTELLGMYTRAYQLMALPAMYLGQVLERVLFPAMAQKQGDRERLRQIFTTSLEVVTLVALPASVGMFMLSKEIIYVLFGSKWDSVVPVLTVLSLGVFFRTAYKCSDTLARSLGAVYQAAARQAVYTVLVLGGAWIGAVTFGVEGVAVAVVVAVAVNYVLMTRLSARFLELSFKTVMCPHLPGIWVSVWMLALLVVGMPWVESVTEGPIARLGAGLAIGIASFGIGWVTAPNWARPHAVAKILERFAVGRLGKVASFTYRALLMRAPW
jgi:PST family polysaccharide transporter